MLCFICEVHMLRMLHTSFAYVIIPIQSHQPPPPPLNSIASAAKLPLAALAAWPFFLLQLQPQSFHSVAALQHCSIAALRLSSLSLLYTLVTVGISTLYFSILPLTLPPSPPSPVPRPSSLDQAQSHIV